MLRVAAQIQTLVHLALVRNTQSVLYPGIHTSATVTLVMLEIAVLTFAILTLVRAIQLV